METVSIRGNVTFSVKEECEKVANKAPVLESVFEEKLCIITENR